MAEILLPTKQTQDAIKQDTESILAQFPISGGTDWRDFSTQTAQIEIGKTTTITGEGILVSAVSSADVANIIFNADNKGEIDLFFKGSAPLMVYFRNSLKLRTSKAGSASFSIGVPIIALKIT